MLDHDELIKRLKYVEPQLCVAFATRCALRVLPLLVADKEKEAFWYWDKIGKSGNVLSVLTAQQRSIYFSAFGRKVNAAYPHDAKAYPYYAIIEAAVSASAHASYAASYSDQRGSVRVATITATATYAALRAAAKAANINLETEIRLDLDKITNKNSFVLNKSISEVISPADFIVSPLWLNSSPEDWQLIYSRFNESLLALSGGFEIWVKWYKDRIESIPMDIDQEEKWLNIPIEIRLQGPKAINDYVASLISIPQSDNKQPLNLVRTIFIGNGAAGKTSLIRKLHNEPVIEGKEEMTPGIQIREWPVPETEIKALFWDFGGQVMSHSTHQFFLRERCLYILVLDARTEFNANDQAEYWLEHVKAFGDGSSVMLVGNKSDLTTVNLDMNTLVEKYGDMIIGFYPVSCTSQKPEFELDFEKFHHIFAQQLERVGTHQVMFTNSQFEMLKQVRMLSRENAFLDHKEFDGLCKQHEIGKVGLDQQAFLGLLDSLGEVVHFPDLEWSDAYILNPRWLTYGVYALLYSDKANKQQGVLSHKDVISILQAETVVDENANELTYPKDKCRFIIDAMSKFKLCYRLPEDNKLFVIPDKLPIEQPDLSNYFDKNAEGTLAFEFNFQGFLPRNVMPNLIVARHQEIIEDKQGKQLVWQHGVIIKNIEHRATARLQVDYHQRILQLWIQGAEPREFLVILRDEIYTVLNDIKGLSIKENVILPEFALINDKRFRLDDKEVEKTTYQSLLEQAKAGQKTLFSDAGNQYDLDKVMGFIMTKEQQNKEGVGNTYNTTYNIDKAGAVGGVGDNHKVSGKIILNAPEKQAVGELQKSLTALMTHIESHDADFKIKNQAYNELQQINEHLANIENATPETKNKLQQLLTSVKDGSLGALRLAKEIKESGETVGWLMEKAAIVSAFLATLPV